MKLAILNDTHCGIRNSSEIFLNNAADFYDNIFFPECEKRGVKHILHLGDYYDHRKFVNFKALNHTKMASMKKVFVSYVCINLRTFKTFITRSLGHLRT